MCVCCRNLGNCLENAIFGLWCSRQIGKAKKHCERTYEVTNKKGVQDWWLRQCRRWKRFLVLSMVCSSDVLVSSSCW